MKKGLSYVCFILCSENYSPGPTLVELDKTNTLSLDQHTFFYFHKFELLLLHRASSEGEGHTPQEIR